MSEHKERLRRRQATNATRSTEANFKSWFTAPEGVETYEIVKGENLIDILPFQYNTNIFKTAYREEDRAAAGDLDYVLIVKIHRSIGLNNENIVCPRQFGLACPICEEVKKFNDEGKDYQEFKEITAKVRVLYNVRNLKERNAPIQLLESSYEWFEKALEARVQRDSARKGEILFADYEDGKSISFFGSEETFNKKTFVKPVDFVFEDRAKQPGPEVLDQTIALDNLFKVLSYEEIEAIYYGTGATSTEEPETVKEEKRVAIKEPEAEAELPKEEPVRKRESVTGKCSKGHELGIDHDNTPDCDACPEEEWKACGKIKRK